MKCIVCQTDFEKHAEKQVFCSKKCCDLNYRQTKKGVTKVAPHIIRCLACHKELLIDNNVRKYCDKKCKNDYKNNLRDTNTMNKREHRQCIVCNNSFFPTRNNKVYCSKNCRRTQFSRANPELMKRLHYEWKNSIQGKKWLKEYYTSQEFKMLRREVLKNNPNLRLANRLRDRIYKAITLQQGHKSIHTRELLGADIRFVREYLSSKFKPGMSWENHSTLGWHIDHIKPCASFDLKDPEQQKKCFHYTNLQPLWWQENLSKNKSLDWINKGVESW